MTPWTHPNKVAVPGNPKYNDGIRGSRATALAPAIYNEFKRAMNNMNLSFTFDYAIAITG